MDLSKWGEEWFSPLILTRSGILESILNDLSKALATLNGTLLSGCPTSLNRGILNIKN